MDISGKHDSTWSDTASAFNIHDIQIYGLGSIENNMAYLQKVFYLIKCIFIKQISVNTSTGRAVQVRMC